MPDSVQPLLERGYASTSATVRAVYENLPDPVRPLVERGFYTLHPAHSWAKKQLPEERTEAFVAEFFDDRAEYERYRDEFFDGRIVDVCQEALAAVDGDQRVYDAHKGECAKLYALVRKRHPETVVETGVYHGISTAAILLGLDRNGSGMLHSIDAGGDVLTAAESDLPEAERRFYERGRPSCAEEGSHELPGDREPGWVVPEDLDDRWELTAGHSRRALPEVLADVGEVSLFLHDSEHSTTGMLFEFELAREWLESGGVVFSLHVDRNDAFETFAAERDCRHGRASYEYAGGFNPPYDAPCSSGYLVKES